jgi:soluble lytic murein transglycosylase-like protein
VKRRVAVVIVAVAIGVLLLPFLLVLTQPLRRRLPMRTTDVKPVAITTPLASLPQEQWTARLIDLEDARDWKTLEGELRSVQQRFPQLFAQYQLGYLQARLNEELEEFDRARTLFQPFIAAQHSFRDLALFHLVEIAVEEDEPENAARIREDLIVNHKESIYRSEAIDEQLSYLREVGDLDRYAKFAGRLRPQADTGLRRKMDAQFVELLMRRGAVAEAKARGIVILKGETGDDPAEQVLTALDRPEVIRTLTPEEVALLGEAAQGHRHFDRAVALLSAARSRLPQRLDELIFAIGRSYFGNEKYSDAQKTYLEGAAGAKSTEMKATFLYHASRCAQLLGDDARAETLMTQAIAVPGRFSSTSAALTQRLRTRARAGRFPEAESDLRQIRQFFANKRPVLEGSVSLATSWLAAGKSENARRVLADVPTRLIDPHDRSEMSYWEGRSWESANPKSALAAYLRVMRADVPTHFAYFARQRVTSTFKVQAETEIQELRVQVQDALANDDLEKARRLQTDVTLLAPNDSRELATLREMYLRLPRYAEIVNLKPRALPAFPLNSGAGRGDLLLAMGLFDEVTDEVPKRFPLRPLDSALTAAHLYNLAGASRPSLQAVEILVRNIPEDFIPELLPRRIQELLYPRYFYGYIREDADKYDADPVLVLAIMREESRFNPRAKSVAAARGLLQFILTTALQIGRDVGLTELSSDDLYDPRIVIQLGAKYIGDLMEDFGSDRYKTASAYNAGPYQARLWGRLAPAAGDDYFLSAINFDETKHYVRKVMNSYHRYSEIYENRGEGGGVRAEP